jgi:tetratricopeptide (TPR) repeat protein
MTVMVQTPLKIAAGAVLLLSLAILSSTSVAQEAKPPDSTTAASLNYFVEGNRHRSEGNCEKALESYRKARELNQFRFEWSFHQAVADCYIVLKKYDNAVEAYTKVIEAAGNKALVAEMYRDRGKAYYYKAAQGGELDIKYIDLARKDLREAARSGLDVADLEKTIAADEKNRPHKHAPEITGDSATVTDQKVSVIESPGRIITGAGEYALFITRDTDIQDKDSHKITVAEMRTGDMLDFTYTAGYHNSADNMMHVTAGSITLRRSVPPEEIKRNAGNAGWVRQISALEDKIDDLNLTVEELQEELHEQNEIEKKPSPPPPAPKKSKKKSAAKLPSKQTEGGKASSKTGEKKLNGETEKLVKKYLSELKQDAEGSQKTATPAKKRLLDKRAAEATAYQRDLDSAKSSGNGKKEEKEPPDGTGSGSGKEKPAQ